MVLEAWDDTTSVAFDRQLWSELCSLRFLTDANNALIMGTVGVGKTFLATALGHAAVRRKHSVLFERADKLFSDTTPAPGPVTPSAALHAFDDEFVGGRLQPIDRGLGRPSGLRAVR